VGRDVVQAQVRRAGCGSQAPAPPEQPSQGPGSSDYAHAGVIEYQFGEGATAYDLFEPADPTPASAPVIVFLHGYGARVPRLYGGWIQHLVRRGNIVVFPRYQAAFFAPAREFTGNAVSAIADALRVLTADGHVAPQPDRLALAGHSAGAVIAANIAGRAAGAGLPAVQALYLADAEDTAFGFFSVHNSILEPESYLRIPPQTLVLAVVGEADHLARDGTSSVILQSVLQVAPADKEIISFASDFYGCPNLIAGHVTVSSVEPIVTDGLKPSAAHRRREPRINALEYYGYWKWLDALTDAAFFGVNREYALGDTPEQTFLGLWSDGTPVTPARVIGP
jgi:pimeloyl-ACP methyl ester carboxylesterase